MTAYCQCETPIMDIEYDAGCRRCGLPVDFTPADPADGLSAEDFAAGQLAAETIAELTGDAVSGAEASAVVAWCREWYADVAETFTDGDEYAGEEIGTTALLRGCDRHIDGGLAFVLADVRRLAAHDAGMVKLAAKFNEQDAAGIIVRRTYEDPDSHRRDVYALIVAGAVVAENLSDADACAILRAPGVVYRFGHDSPPGATDNIVVSGATFADGIVRSASGDVLYASASAQEGSSDDAGTFATPYLVCLDCGHAVTVNGPADCCENCRAGASSLAYFTDAGAADDEAARIAENCS